MDPTSPVAQEAPPSAPLRFTPRFAGALLLVAVLASSFAIAFRAGLSGLFSLAGHRDVVAVMLGFPWPVRLVLPAVGGLFAGLIGLVVARAPAGHGVGDVMEAVVLGRVRLSTRVTLLKSLASFLAIASGGSLGREGPLIQFGGAGGKLVGERLGLSRVESRILIAAGSAAGFAAAYNTPFAAILFVVEVVAGVMAVDVVVPAVLATAIANLITRAALGAGPLYGQRSFRLDSAAELVAFAVLGLSAALGAQGFMRALSWGERTFRARLSLPWRPAVGGLLAGGIVAALPAVAGNGFEPLSELLDGRMSLGLIALLLAGKCLATTASVGSGSPGGVFTPTLLVGGAIGFLFASGLAAVGVPVGPPGGYALVGMAAATAASVHAPLLAAVMVFELSGDYAIVLPLLLATSIATVVSRALRRESIYTAELAARGISWELTMDGRRMDPEDPPRT